jgi:hypothetical protein
MTTKSQEATPALIAELEGQIEHYRKLFYKKFEANAEKTSQIHAQAFQIAELKAKLAEVMPLAKLGAEVANHADGMGAVSSVVIWRIAKRVGVLTHDESEYTPNIESTITKLLKD